MTSPIWEKASQTCSVKYLLFRKNTFEKVHFLSKAAHNGWAALLKMTFFIGLFMV